MKRAIAITFVIAGFLTIWMGVHDVNNAKTWLEFTRGLFWIFVGMVVTASSVDEARGKS